MFPTHVGMNRGISFMDMVFINMFPTHVGMNRFSIGRGSR